MSRISQDFIASVGYLYEEINIQQEDFLNEESRYYDAEATELVEDILSTISSMMVYEGYSAEGIIGFLADSSEETIIEKYLSFDENVLTESAISEEYVVEQLEIFDIAINEGLGTLIGKVAKGALGLAGRIASKPARMAVAKKMMQSKDPAKTAAAVDRLARMKLTKSGAPSDFTKKIVDAAPDVATKTRIAATAPVVGKIVKGVQKVKDIAKGAKAALPKIAKYGLAGGAGVLAGYLGTKMGGAGEKTPEAPKPAPSSKYNAAAALGGQAAFKAGGGAAKMKKNPEMTAADVQKQGMINIRNKKPPVAAPKPSPAPAPAAKPESQSEKPKDSTWTFNNKQVTDAEVNKKYQELRKTDPKAAEDFGRNVHSQKFGQLQKGPANVEIDKSSVEASIKAQQKIDKERADKALKDSQSSMKESYEPYEVLLEYLIGGGHADTIEEAHYIMLEMDASAVRAVMEEYEDYLLAEEVSEWVDGLLNEGHDLSEYSWDDIVEYYVNEARVDAGLSDDEKREARGKRGTVGYMHPFTRKVKKTKGEKTELLGFDRSGNPTGKYLRMKHEKRAAQRERDADEQRTRDRGGMSRGTWDKD